MRSLAACLALATLAFAACGDNNDNQTVDARVDGATDAPDIDAGIDAPDIDAAVDAAIDATEIDAPMIDAPMIDASTMGQIEAVRATADGTGLTLPIEGATVTYLKPALGDPANDPAGFTIQATQGGPAIFVAIDPAMVNPPAAVGDVVSFTVTTLTTVIGQRRITAVSNYTRLATGANVGALAQNITAATDLITGLGDYEAEIVDVTGTVAAAFGGAGSGFESAQITTTGMPTADTNLRLRVVATLRNSIDLVVGCTFTLDNTPVGRFNAQTQLAAFTASDITLTGCPAPTVVSAAALSPTSVRVTFDRNVLPASLMASGAQFTFNNGLTASAASLSGRAVTLTTSAQTAGMPYTLTVANTVTDLQGSPVGTPNTATFDGFSVPAVLRINELNANIASGCDLIELRVITGGSTANFRLTERIAGTGELNMTLPSVNVATNDLIVVHLGSGSATCNPGTAVSETTSITQQPVATFTRNYDTAWDFWDVDTGLTSTDNVLTLLNPAGMIVDVVFSAQAATGTAAAATETAAESARAADQWRLNDGTLPAANFYVDDAFRGNAALDLDGTGTAASGTSIQRLDNTDDNNTADWNSATITVQNSTFGALNVGQTPL